MRYDLRTPPEEIHQSSRQRAEADLKEGILGRRTFGLIRSPDLLKQAYEEKGVRCVIIAGDCVDSQIVADAEGYNSVMDPAILRKYPAFFQEVRQRHLELRAEANKKWKEEQDRG